MNFNNLIEKLQLFGSRKARNFQSFRWHWVLLLASLPAIEMEKREGPEAGEKHCEYDMIYIKEIYNIYF